MLLKTISRIISIIVFISQSNGVFACAEDAKSLQEGGRMKLDCYKMFTELPQRDGKPVYPDRFVVPDDKRSWKRAYLEYNPPYYRDHTVEANTVPKGHKWAEPESKINVQNLDVEVFREFLAASNDEGIPRNPCGRTGIVGQGLLGKWGENWAADPIITRYDPTTGKLMLLLIKRGDGGEWAIPGGMVNPEETKLSMTAARELKEETGLDIKMDMATEVYEGIVDDSRNTDNSWIMTKAYHLHLNNDVSKEIDKKILCPMDVHEVKAIQWILYDDDRLNHLFASHSKFIGHVMGLIKEKEIQPF
jgi:ADP-ribose pyrophosphatase